MRIDFERPKASPVCAYAKDAKIMATVSAKEIAAQLGVDPKRFRSFLRSYLDSKGLSDMRPGQGGRYAFNEDNVEKVKEAFVSWRKSGKVSLIIFDNENETIESETNNETNTDA